MINISENPVHIDTSKYQSFQKISLSSSNRRFKRWLMVFFVSCIAILLLPWTQNIRAKGKVTTLSPDQRPQSVNATISGRIEHWYVNEGQYVKRGDTILYLSEVKSEYFDPNLIARTAEQVRAKQAAVGSYASKATALDQQIKATLSELQFKKEQLKNKIEQTKLKAESEKNDQLAAEIDLRTETEQLRRTEKMYTEGITPLTAVENKRLKVQQAQAKLVGAANKYQNSLQEMDNLRIQLSGADAEYQGKIAKSQSDKFSTLSDQYDATATVSKLKNQQQNYETRAQFYYVTAPQDGYITRATPAGIGEIVKEGETVVGIVPTNLNLAVEMFVEPIDLPLIKTGSPVRFIFDGWPAFIFSGWPNASVGSYSGKIFSIENVADSKGKYRVLVAPDANQAKWPDALRPGSGANGIAMLKDVPVWYELWRQLNGFPPEFYTDLNPQKEKSDAKK